jgi:hypothetical protein
MTSSASLQRDAVATRAGLSSTLDELRSTFTTSALTSGAMTFAQEGSATLARAAIDRARANPLAALLIGAGLVMLMGRTGEGTGSAIVGKASDAVSGAVKGTVSALSGAAGATRSAARDSAATTQRVAGQATDMATQAAASASGAISQAVGSAKSMASDAVDRAKDATDAGISKAQDLIAEGRAQAGHAVDETQHYVAAGRDMLAQFAEEQPILVAALGVALGAAIGAALPITDAERTYLGAAGERVTSAGKSVATKVADAVTEQVAGTDIGAAVDKAAAGLTGIVKDAAKA